MKNTARLGKGDRMNELIVAIIFSETMALACLISLTIPKKEVEPLIDIAFLSFSVLTFIFIVRLVTS